MILMKHPNALCAVLCVLFFTGHSGAQETKDRTFSSLGFSPYTDVMVSPSKTYTVDAGTTNEATYSGQYIGVSLFTFIYNYRYNLSEPSDNSAFTASAIPALGVFFGDNGGKNDGFGSFNLPLMLGYEFGAGSTYNSISNAGGFIRLGLEWTLAPMIGIDNNDGADIPNSWVEPVAQAGVRYWNKKNKLREIHVKYGMGAAAESDILASNGTSRSYCISRTNERNS